MQSIKEGGDSVFIDPENVHDTVSENGIYNIPLY